MKPVFKSVRKAALACLTIFAAAVSLPASAQDKPTYKIGYIGPITGPNTSVGVGTMNSLHLAIMQANERGDLPFNLEFIAESDDSKPAAGVAAVQKICADPSVLAVSAHWNSPVAMATGPYFNDCGLLNLISGASANGITKQGWKAVGRVNSPFSYALPALAKIVFTELGIKKVAIIRSLDDFGNETSSGFANAFEKLGGEIVFNDGYNIGDRDFTAIITRMRSSRPEAVFHGGVSTEAALILRQMRQLGMKQPYLGHSGFQTTAYAEAVASIGDGTLVASQAPFPEDLAEGKKFLEDYAAAGFKDPPDVYGVFGYAAGQTIVELIRRHGPDRKAIVEGFRNDKDIKTVLGTQAFDQDGELQPKLVGISVLESGVWTSLRNVDYKTKYLNK